MPGPKRRGRRPTRSAQPYRPPPAAQPAAIAVAHPAQGVQPLVSPQVGLQGTAVPMFASMLGHFPRYHPLTGVHPVASIQSMGGVEDNERDPTIREDNVAFDRICELERSNDSLLQNNRGLNCHVKALSKDKERLKRNHDDLKEQNESMQQTNRGLQADVQSLQKRNRSLKEEVKALRADLAALRQPSRPARTATAENAHEAADASSVKSESPSDDDYEPVAALQRIPPYPPGGPSGTILRGHAPPWN